MRLIGWAVLLWTRRRNPYIQRTLSFWSAATGLTLLATRSRLGKLAGIFCLNVVALGGLGVSYERVAKKVSAPLEPAAVISATLRQRQEVTIREEVLSASWHAVFGMIGLWELSKIIKGMSK